MQVESWLFGAGVYVSYWKAADTKQALNMTILGDVEVHLSESWGFRFAEKLLRESIFARMSSTQLMSS